MLIGPAGDARPLQIGFRPDRNRRQPQMKLCPGMYLPRAGPLLYGYKPIEESSWPHAA
jgi:hypothetical protein